MHSILLSTPTAGESLVATFVPMILLFVFMYFIMIRPQQKANLLKNGRFQLAEKMNLPMFFLILQLLY